MTALIGHCIRIGHRPKAWKRVKRVMLQKPNKLDYTTVKLYRVISFFICLWKVCEKVVAVLLAEWWEINHVLHNGQMRSRRQ